MFKFVTQISKNMKRKWGNVLFISRIFSNLVNGTDVLEILFHLKTIK